VSLAAAGAVPVSPAAPGDEGARDLAYYEAVPYLLVMESVERGGIWVRRAEYPELPGCAAEAPSAVEAFEALEGARLLLLRNLWDRGAPIPVPRPPLRRCPPGSATPAA
jgi:predicted RNase H-like HicB family nuclease